MDLTVEKKLHYTLRVASACCFIGHGAFGIITKQIWCNYFAVFGIGQGLAYQLMPVLGTFDIAMGLLMLFYPIRAVPLWLMIWGILTASLRPLSGEPFAEFIERAGNFGAPVALLLLERSNWKSWKLFGLLRPPEHLDQKTSSYLLFCLQVLVFLLLAGHGWLNILEKKGLVSQYASLGFTRPTAVAHAVGLFEIFAAFTILIRPIRSLLFVLLIWKMATELFYPHHELFEWVERGGSYGCLLALWFVSGDRSMTGIRQGFSFRISSYHHQ